MSAEIVAGIVAFLLLLIGGGAGWVQVRKHGAIDGKLKQAKGERDAARKDDKIAARPPLTGRESVGVLRRLRARFSSRG